MAFQTGKIATRIEVNDAAEKHEKEYVKLARLFVLGEKYQDASFKNTIVDAILAKHEDFFNDGQGGAPDLAAIDVVYRGTCAGSPARELLVDMWVDQGYVSFIENANSLNHEFVRDLCAKAFAAYFNYRSYDENFVSVVRGRNKEYYDLSRQ